MDDRPIIDNPIRQAEGNARFAFMLRNQDELVQELAVLLAAEAAPDTELEAVVELAQSVAAYWRQNHGEPDDPAAAARELVLELRKIWDGEVTELKQLARRTSSNRPRKRNDPSKTKKRPNRTKAKAKRKAARKARKRK